MKIFILTLGTRGDFELFRGLASELASRGHQITLGTSGFFIDDAQRSGLQAVQIGGGTLAELRSILQSLTTTPDRTERTRLYAKNWLSKQLNAGQRQIARAVGDTDYFVSNLKLAYKRGDQLVPCCMVTYDPPQDESDLAKYVPTGSDSAVLQLVAMNRKLVDPDEIWPDHFRFTGFWQPPTNNMPVTTELKTFVGVQPPIVMTMGSMVTFDADALHAKFVAALRSLGRRGVFVNAWSDRPVITSYGIVHCVDQVPYDWLFPRSACIVHHGGCGTSAAAIRAAKPSILMPQITSQRLIAQMLQRERLATHIMDLESATASEIASAIKQTVENELMLANAKLWQEQTAIDRGLAEAADQIERQWEQIRNHE